MSVDVTRTLFSAAFSNEAFDFHSARDRHITPVVIITLARERNAREWDWYYVRSI